MMTKTRKRVIRENSPVRAKVAQFPTYWNCAEDAIRAMRYTLEILGYELSDSWHIACDRIRFEKWDEGESKTYTIPIVNTENCLFFSAYKMRPGRFEITTYISL